MNTDKIKYVKEEIIAAYNDFIENKGSMSPEEWLEKYLRENLPDKALDVIHTISGEIISTLDIMEEKKAAMNSAIDNGKSAEEWLADDMYDENESKGSIARNAAVFLNEISKAQCEMDITVEAEVVDVSEDAPEWMDAKWNSYNLKDTLKNVAVEIGKTGIREVASDVMLKASEEGITAVADKEFVVDVAVDLGERAMKIALSAALSIACEKADIPKTTTNVLAATAFKTVESFSAIGDVIKGKSTMTEAISKIKNTAVATFSGMVEMHKPNLRCEIVDMAQYAFGFKGAVIAGTVFNLLFPDKGQSRLKSTLIGFRDTAWQVLTKEREWPFRKSKTIQITAET